VTSDSSPVQAEPGPDGPDNTTGTGIDTTVPHSARIWNYWLGGTDNYAVDREAGDAGRDLFLLRSRA
jgi:S-adenosyl methyltransferase